MCWEHRDSLALVQVSQISCESAFDGHRSGLVPTYLKGLAQTKPFSKHLIVEGFLHAWYGACFGSSMLLTSPSTFTYFISSARYQITSLGNSRAPICFITLCAGRCRDMVWDKLNLGICHFATHGEHCYLCTAGSQAQ